MSTIGIAKFSVILDPHLRKALWKSWLESASLEEIEQTLQHFSAELLSGNTQALQAWIPLIPIWISSSKPKEALLNIRNPWIRMLFEDIRAPRILKKPCVSSSGEGSESLGAKKALAASYRRPALDRLLRECHPHIVQKLVANPRLRLEDILRIATKRPTYPQTLKPILESRWMVYEPIRMALALNPYLPTSWAIPILPTLALETLSKRAGQMHPKWHRALQLLKQHSFKPFF